MIILKAPFIHTIKGHLFKILLLTFYFPAFQVESQQNLLNCNTLTPWIPPTFTVVETHSSPQASCWEGDGGCPGTDVPANVVNASTTDFATGNILITGSLVLRVTDNTNDYSAGNFVGYRIASSLIQVNLLGSITISTFLDGNPVESATAGNLLTIGLDLSNDQLDLGFITTMAYDAVQITISNFLGLGSYDVYYAIMEDFCPGPGLDPCNTQIAMNSPAYPVTIDYLNTGSSGITVGEVLDPEDAISASTTDYASLVNFAGVVGNTFITVEEQVTNYPAGTFVGFDIQNLVVVGAGVLNYITITSYLNDVPQETIAGPDLLISGNALGNSGRQTIGFVTTTAVDKVRVSIHQPLGINLGTTRVYSAIFQSFCPGDLTCNEPTSIHNPAFPVFIDGEHTGFTGAACALCDVENAGNVIDADTSNWAEIDVIAGVTSIGSLAVKDQLTNYAPGTFAGFHIENPSLVNTSLFGGITITTFLEGVQKESKTNLGPLITVGSGLLTATGEYYIGFVTTQSFDEVKISLSNVGVLNIGTTKIFSAILEEFCSPELECDTTYYLINPEFPVYIDAFLTGMDGLACGGCDVQDEQNVITPDTSDYATIEITAGVIEAGSIAVGDALNTYPAGTFAGFVIEDVFSYVEATLLQSITIRTYNNGVFQELRSGVNLIDLDVLVLFISDDDGRYNIGFETTLPFDEIRISVGSLATVSNEIRVYSAFVDTRVSDGGSLLCVDGPDAVDDYAITDEDSPVNIDVLENDSDSEGPLGNPTMAENPNHGDAIPNAVDSSFTYTPDENFVGLDTFSYSLCNDDSPPVCDTAMVFITVNPVIDTITETIPEDDSLTVCANELTTYNNPATSISICEAPSNGSAQASVDCVTYVPAPGFMGNDTMCVVSCHPDIPSMCDTTIVIIIVTPVNDPPDAVDDEASTQEDVPVSIDVLENDSDPDSPLSLPIVQDLPSNGMAVVNPVDSTILYSPNVGFVGIDTFTYSICDDQEPPLCDTANVYVTVYPGMDTTVYSIPQDSMINVCASLIINVGGPIEIMTVCDSSNNGTLILIDTCVQYIPDPEFSGEDTICVVACGPNDICDTAIIVILVDLPLPLKWLFFQVEQEGTSALLRWMTTDEINNAGFQVERSKNGYDFEGIGNVEAIAVAGEITSYHFKDHHPSDGQNYYRIRQMDVDGSFSYSNIENIHFVNDVEGIKAWPNPVNGTLNIHLPEDARHFGEIKLVDLSGKVVEYRRYDNQDSIFLFDISRVQAGLYNLIIETTLTHFHERIVVIQ